MNYLKKPYNYIVALIVAVIVLYGCEKEEDPILITPSTDDYNRSILLTNLTDNYIIPAYREYASQTTSLKNQVMTFNNVPTIALLQSLRTQWENTLLVWQDVAFLELGPASTISLRSQTNIYPVDTVLINNNINSGMYDLQLPSNFDAKGFQAIDYLINGKATTDQDIVDFFSNSTNGRMYLQAIVDELATNASSISNEWETNYSSTFIANTASNAQGSAISDIVNALNLHYEVFIRKAKIGLPAGVFNGFSQLPLPSHVEALYYGQSLPFLHRSLTAMQAFINGENYTTTSNGEGLNDYIDFVDGQTGGQPLEMVINDQLNLIKTALTTINDPLSEEVNVNNAAVKAVYQELQKLVAYLKVDMTNALDVLITYQDSDGD